MTITVEIDHKTAHNITCTVLKDLKSYFVEQQRIMHEEPLDKLIDEDLEDLAYLKSDIDALDKVLFMFDLQE